jgi:hypothetical protein
VVVQIAIQVVKAQRKVRERRVVVMASPPKDSR